MIAELVAAALERDPKTWPSFVNDTWGDNLKLRAEVESLLQTITMQAHDAGLREPGISRKQRRQALCYFTTPISARRFLAQASSFEAGSVGISAPKLTV